MFVQFIFLSLMTLAAGFTFHRGVRMLQGHDIMLGIQANEKIYSRLSPNDKRLFGLMHVFISGGYFIVFGLALLGLTSEILYTILWLAWAALAFVGTPAMKRRSTYVPPETHEPIIMPTLES